MAWGGVRLPHFLSYYIFRTLSNISLEFFYEN